MPRRTAAPLPPMPRPTHRYPPPAAARPAWTDALEAYIEDNLARRITLDDLGAWIQRSASFVSQHFPRYFGASPRRHVLLRRMERAKTLLQQGALVREAARQMGCYDAFHFSKVFRAHWGEPPSRFGPQ